MSRYVDLRVNWMAEAVSLLLDLPLDRVLTALGDEGPYFDTVQVFLSGNSHAPVLYFYQDAEAAAQRAAPASRPVSQPASRAGGRPGEGGAEGADTLVASLDPPGRDCQVVVYAVRRFVEGQPAPGAITEIEMDDEALNAALERAAAEGPSALQVLLTDEVRSRLLGQLEICVTLGKLLPSLACSLEYQFPPLLTAQSETEMTFQSRKLAVAAASTEAQLSSQFAIDVPDYQIVDPKQAAVDAQLVAQLQQLFEGWTLVLQDALDAYRELQPAGWLPMDEVECWRRRAALISTLYEDLCSPRFRLMFQVLEHAHSQVYAPFSYLRQEVSKACLEARDNSRFLSTLERHFKLLARAPLSTLPDSIASLYNAIRMVWTISRYYNTEERLLPLMERIVYQLAQRVREGVDVREIFTGRGEERLAGATEDFYGRDGLTGSQAGGSEAADVPAEEAGEAQKSPTAALYAARDLLTRWKTAYHETRAQIESSNREARRWEFEKRVMFGTTDFLLSRVESLITCSEALSDFSQILSPEVQRVTGDASGLRQVKIKINELPRDLIAFGPRIWEPSCNEEFQLILEQFQARVSEVEQAAFEYIDRSFARLRSVTSALDLVIRLKAGAGQGAGQGEAAGQGAGQGAGQAAGPASEPLLASHMASKIEDILGQYCDELRRCRQEFEEKKDNPPLGLDLPPLAGSIVWARSLFVTVKTPHRMMKALGEDTLKVSPAAMEASSLFTELTSSLREFEQKRFTTWRSAADDIILKSLRSPLLGEKQLLTIRELRGEGEPQTGRQREAPPSLPQTARGAKGKKAADPDALPQTASQSDVTGGVFHSPTVSSLILKEYGYELMVNFPPQLNYLIEEVSALDRLGFRVGETALNVCLQKNKYEKHADGVRTLIQTLNASLSDFLPRFDPSGKGADVKRQANDIELIRHAVKKCALVIRPGFGPLNWNSLSVEDYLERAISAASELGQSCQQILKAIGNIEQCVRFIANTKLIPSQTVLFTGTDLPYARPATRGPAEGGRPPQGAAPAASPADIMKIAERIKKRQERAGKRPDSPTTLYLAAMREAEHQAPADEEEYEAMPHLPLPEFTARLEEFRTRATLAALDKYDSLSRALVKIEEFSFGSDTGSYPGLQRYYAFWTNRVFNALVSMITTGLRDYYLLLRGSNASASSPENQRSKFLRDRYCPLFALTLNLSSPEIIVTPSLSNVMSALTSQVDLLCKVAAPFVLWGEGTVHSARPVPATSSEGARILSSNENATAIRRSELYRSGGPQVAAAPGKADPASTEEVVVLSFYPRVSQHQAVVSLYEDLNSKIHATIRDVQEYVQTWLYFEHLWKNPRAQVIPRFAAASTNLTVYDSILSFFNSTMDSLSRGFDDRMAIFGPSSASKKQSEALAEGVGETTVPDETALEPASKAGGSRFFPDHNSADRFDLSCEDLYAAIPVAGALDLHPPYKLLLGFATLTAAPLASSLISECKLWREGVCRALLEKARPMMLDLYREIDEELANASMESTSLDLLKAVLSTLERVRRRSADAEHSWRTVEAYYDLIQTYGGVVPMDIDEGLLSSHSAGQLAASSSALGSAMASALGSATAAAGARGFAELGASAASVDSPSAARGPGEPGTPKSGSAGSRRRVRTPDEELFLRLRKCVVEGYSEAISSAIEDLDFGWAHGSVKELLAASEQDPRLCNSDMQPVAAGSGHPGLGGASGNPEDIAALTSSLLGASRTQGGAAGAGSQTGSQTGGIVPAKHSKKASKTVNCRVFNLEVMAAADIKRRWALLLRLVNVVDVSLDATKRRFAEVTQRSAKEFEAQLAEFIREFTEQGPNVILQGYYSELEAAAAEGGKPSRTLVEVMAIVDDSYKEFRERLNQVIRERDRTLLAQRLFNLEPTNTVALAPVERELETLGRIMAIFEQVQDTFSEWDTLLFTTLDPTVLDAGCDSLRTTLRKLPPELRTHKTYEAVDTVLKQYKDSVPLLQDLRNDALRPRHWAKLEQLTGQTLFTNQEQAGSLTLGQLTSLDLNRYAQEINDIVVGARKELSIEKGLQEITETWTKTKIPVKKYENARGQERGFILRSLDDIIAQIEDNSLNLQSMGTSKYVAHFASEVRLWEKRLSVISDVLESWIICQRQWLYLEGIFSQSEDLKVQLPDEAQRFERIDQAYIKLMIEVGKTGASVLDACQASGRLTLLKTLISQMEASQKALTDYLNSKRSLFTRFYFVSDDELLFLLGNSSDPSAVQTHLRKMFEGVSHIDFQRGTNNVAQSVTSPEGETLAYQQPVKIETSSMPIEVWMGKIDQEAKSSLKMQIKSGIFDFGQNYTSQTRVAWVLKHMGQVSLVASMVWWTYDVELAFRQLESGEDINAMKATAQRYARQIEDLVLEIRKDLTRHNRLKINTLIITDMHNRDMLDQFVRDSIVASTDFMWESQLRFYWDRLQDTVVVRQSSNSPIYYNYEYLGLSSRLVITPLTDRCIITLTTALSFYLGGSPAGPAGTGKTETVKDLAKSLGVFCLVVNCSEGMDFRSYGNILAGVAESGVWQCADEFNRIEASVLSVISGQIKTIQVGLMTLAAEMQKDPSVQAGKILLDGREISVRPTAAIFITMNPGYAGRTELPDNLKALFRPIIMSKPDNAIIAEVMFLAEGFLNSRVLSRKMTVLYSLASEQLSKQYHYDFGLRALKSVLVNAGKLKRSDPDADEELLLMKALRDMNLPKFVFEDVPLFMGLITDLCPGIHLDPPDVEGSASSGGAGAEKTLTIASAARAALEEAGYEILPNQILKVQQLQETLQARHSVMVVGPSQGGKSVILQAFAQAMTKMGCKTVYQIINPKSIPVSELYGVLNPDTREWIDGLLSKVFRNINDPSFYMTNPTIAAAAQNPGTLLMPILFDGDIDAPWIENMNSVMDDSKLLTLPNSERIRLQDWCKLLFEVADLQYASPATVSRCGMVWVDTKNLGYEPRYRKWARERFIGPQFAEGLSPEAAAEAMAVREEVYNVMLALYAKYVPPLVDFILNGIRMNSATGQAEASTPLRLVQPVSDINMVSQFCNLFDDIVRKCEEEPVDDILVAARPGGEREGLGEKQGAAGYRFAAMTDPLTIEALFVFCLTWSLGAQIAEADRAAFDSYLREVSGLPLKSGISVNETVSVSHLPGGMITAAAGIGSALGGYGSASSGLGAQQTSTLYDFYFDLRRNCWCPWSQFVRPYVKPADGRFSSIIVQTLDTVRTTWLLDTMVKNLRNVLFVGESGNAKTTIMRSYIAGLSPEKYVALSMNFSSRTNSQDVQLALEDNLDRRSKDTLGPPSGKRMIFFTDELSMPAVDLYGTMQCIAMLKFLVERKGLFDRNPKSLSWRRIVDIQIGGCYKPVGGASNRLDPRFVSLFSTLNVSTPTEDSLAHIYNSIFTAHLKDAGFQFDSSGDQDNNYRYIESLSQKITSATLSVYTAILQGLSPTPSRFHYLFNLRDLSRVYEGLCQALPEKFHNSFAFVKLWRNEFLRVFSDRLICQEDKEFVNQRIVQAITEYFSDVDGVENALLDPLVYGDFREMPQLLENYENARMGVDPDNVVYRCYEELTEGTPTYRVVAEERPAGEAEAAPETAAPPAEGQPEPEPAPDAAQPAEEPEAGRNPFDLVRELAQMALDAYNQTVRPPLKGIVLFDDALAHLINLHRVLRTPRGSMLLVGYGGSGRRSLTRLATFMCGYELYEISLSKSYGEAEFKEDLKELFRRLAPPKNAGKQITFLFTDQHVAEESFLEYINSLLTTGAVPALFPDEEREALANQVRADALANGCSDTRDALWGYFLAHCRDRLHIVLSMNPVGETLRKRCRNFPGFVSSCVIDWYTSWSDDALRSVSRYTLETSESQPVTVVEPSIFGDEGAINREKLADMRVKLLHNIVEATISMHKAAVALSDDFWTQVRRRNFVTPRNFVDFLTTYLIYLRDRRNATDADIARFASGLQKLSQAEEEVTGLQVTLNEQSVILEQKTISCNELLKTIETQSRETERLQQEANETEAALTKQEQEITAEKAEAEEQLAQAMPALEAADAALNQIDPAAIAEMRAFNNPPEAVRQICECVTVFLRQDTDPNWTKAKACMSGNFISDLRNFKRNTLRDRTVKFVETKYLSKKTFTRENIAKVSTAGLCLYDWVVAIVRYYAIAKDVEPKRQRVAKAEEQLEQSQKELRLLRQKIVDLENESTRLQSELQRAQQEEQELKDSAALMAKRLDAAKRLIAGLSTEKVRWGSEADRLREARRRLVGDCLLTAAYMSYSSGFTYEYRLRLLYDHWCTEVLDRRIPCSVELEEAAGPGQKPRVKRTYRPELLLTSDVEILQWNSEGLPADDLSVQNGVLITHTPKWPYVVDPQLQVNRWLKEKEKGNKLIVRSVNDDDVLKQLELAITYGAPFLMENCGEAMDPILSPIIEKDIRDSAGRKYMLLGDKEIDYDPGFRLYMTTKLPNPSLSPDMFGSVTVVNHLVTESGLESQLLNVVVRRERPDLENKRMSLVKNMSSANTLLKTLEETLLRELTSATGVIVDNAGLIQTLESTKSKATELQASLSTMAVTAAEIEEARGQYRPVAVRGTTCFFVMSSLSVISKMYQYSLQAFMEIFTKSLSEAQTDSSLEVRLNYIIEKLTENVYNYVCTSLFEVHKLMFSFQLATRIVAAEYPHNSLPEQELSFFVKGDVGLDECPIPCPHPWISQSGWKDLVRLQHILSASNLDQSVEECFLGSVRQRREAIAEGGLARKYPTITSAIFKDLINDITSNEKAWRQYWDEERPELLPLPSVFSENPFITDLQRLCILRCLRPDRVYVATQLFVASILGEKYITPPVTLYENIYKQSTRSTPILFILSPGSDPIVELTKLAQKHDYFGSRFKFVALGQGQSGVAEAYTKTAIQRGHWVLLMNCHLLPKWLKTLEKLLEAPMNAEQLVQMQNQILEAAKQESEQTGQPIPQEIVENQVVNQINKQVNQDFRIFLTTEPTDSFPLSIVSNSIKVTTEPPSSLRLNMLQTFSKITESQLQDCQSPYFKPLVYTLAFFHATIQERQKFGKLGWNVKYDFNASDFTISFEILKIFLTKAYLSSKDIPWSSLKYLMGLCMYGGRVSDTYDRRVLEVYMEEYLGDFLFDTHNRFSFYKLREEPRAGGAPGEVIFDYAPPPVAVADNAGNQTVAMTDVLTKLIRYSVQHYGQANLPGWNPGAPEEENIANVLRELTTVKECYETFYVNRIPLLSSPQVFGLHGNAEISYLESATREMWVSLAELQPRSSGGESVSKEDFLAELCKTLEGRIPAQIDLLQAKKKLRNPGPTTIVLLQEIERYDRLIALITESIAELQKALAGEIGMSEQLDAISTSFFIGQIPQAWRRFAPQTLKPLSSWVQHLIGRADQYRNWLANGEPAVIWLSGLHIPESYLTALVQVTSRLKRWPLDRSALFTTVTKFTQASDVAEKLDYGCYITGLFLEGASWDLAQARLRVSRKKELMCTLPLVQIVPAEASRIKLRNQFTAPVYVTTARTNAAGTGLVFSANLSSYEHDSLWVLQGVAVILNDN